MFSRIVIVGAWTSDAMTFAQAAANLQVGRALNAMDYEVALGQTAMGILWATAAVGAVLASAITGLHVFQHKK
jgi:hypothetical protein